MASCNKVNSSNKISVSDNATFKMRYGKQVNKISPLDNVAQIELEEEGLLHQSREQYMEEYYTQKAIEVENKRYFGALEEVAVYGDSSVPKHIAESMPFENIFYINNTSDTRQSLSDSRSQEIINVFAELRNRQKSKILQSRNDPIKDYRILNAEDQTKQNTYQIKIKKSDY